MIRKCIQIVCPAHSVSCLVGRNRQGKSHCRREQPIGEVLLDDESLSVSPLVFITPRKAADCAECVLQ